MESQCQVAKFIRQQIQLLGKPQTEIAEEVGFEKPNVITMIKQGKTKLPLDRVGRMAKALEADPVYLMKLCLSTYYPETWKFIEPLLDSTLTQDERSIVQGMRTYVGTPYLAGLSMDSKKYLAAFLLSLRTPTSIQ